MPRTPRKHSQDVRDYPIYSIPEVAAFLGLPERTVREWFLDKPLWEIAGHRHGVYLLSFRDLAQAHAVELITRHYKTPLAKIRQAFQEAKKETKSQYPLLSKNIKMFLKQIVLDKPARGKQPRRAIVLTQHRQMAIPEFVDAFGTRFRWDNKGVAEIFPWRLWKPEDDRKPVSVDPQVMSGKLVVTGTRVPVETILSRKKAGHSVRRIAEDYSIKSSVIEDALTHIQRERKAA